MPRCRTTAGRSNAPGELDEGAILLRPERSVKAVRLVCTSDGNGTPIVVVMPPGDQAGAVTPHPGGRFAHNEKAAAG